MRVNVNYGFTGDGDEDWAVACLYLTDVEIDERGLVSTNYNGGEYDWITLPDRECKLSCCDVPQPEEKLVAAYGGMLSEICEVKSVCNGTTASGAYYAPPGWEDESYLDADVLPSDLQNALFAAIEERCGNYDPDDFEEPFFNGDCWAEGKEVEEEEEIASEYSGDVKVGIYDTEISLKVYDDKAILTLPYIKWVNNNGNLDFQKHEITDEKEIDVLRLMFAEYDDDPLPLRERLNYLYGF